MTEREHLLTIVAEECNETAQRCSKAVRFGLSEIQPGQTLRNDERIIEEFNDLVGAMEELFDKPINEIIDRDKVIKKKRKILEYMDYAEQQGTIKGR